MAGLGRSFGGVADYCLHDRLVPGEVHPESAERVEWTETRNVATNHEERAARIMAATGRKLEKPVCHYSLNWAKDERPDRQRAEERMRWGRYQRGRGKALGELERRTKRGAAGQRLSWGIGALRGRPKVLGRFRAELEGWRQRERVSLGKAHSEAVLGIECKEGEAYTATAWKGRRNGHGRR